MERTDVGIVGLAVMGQNLALNVESRGYSVIVYNRTEERTRGFVEKKTTGKRIVPAYRVEDLVAGLKRPRKLLLMVKAGDPTDTVLEQILPLLGPGDVVMDGGNAHFSDTDRRSKLTESRGIHYLGLGVSGGEAGALYGPSIMAGGAPDGFAAVREILEAISARGPKGPCCGYFGPSSAGHYVKMVHNGIEYAIMQGLAEAYDLMKRGMGLSAIEIANQFGEWNRGDLESYLVGITERILRKRDPQTGTPLVEVIRDTASQKGTGRWSSQSALDLGAPSPTIAAAVFGRIVSALKSERETASELLSGPHRVPDTSRPQALSDLCGALLLTIVTTYAQGFRQLQDASRDRGYGFELPAVARVWMGGCIVRAKLLVSIAQAFADRPDLPLLLLADPFRTMWRNGHEQLRRIVCSATAAGLPIPVMSSALTFVDAYRSSRLPANLLQAQRDYFGAHTYERVDRTGSFHTDWETP